jgi:hypothetical protein
LTPPDLKKPEKKGNSMGKIKTIRVEYYKTGEGKEAHEFEYCPIYFAFQNKSNECPFGAGVCKYGLTEVESPEHCPIRKSIEFKFKLV